MVYYSHVMDHFTKFHVLWALVNKCAEEVVQGVEVVTQPTEPVLESIEPVVTQPTEPVLESIEPVCEKTTRSRLLRENVKKNKRKLPKK
ncbi:unnamed protein product [Brachionus calyciflorus]|uniref:Uncharacterized protein n=1 Tax=Brachionus calyciflorus TaxID=104777 RepID=A0A814S917_9BILA|nr:unnamed protein product [Brachionus calyciflorus]